MNRPFKTIRHLLLLLATAAAALCPGEARADQVMYIDELGMPQTVDATQIKSDTRELDYQYPGNWYYVSGNVTIDGNLSPSATSEVDGKAYIILCDKATLTVTGTIDIPGTLSIYAQSTGNEITGNNMGRLLMTSSDPFAGSDLSICGGRITIDNPFSLSFFTFHSGQFTAPAIHAEIIIECRNATDFLQIGTYNIPDDISCKISFGRKIMVNDDPTNTIASSTILHYGDDTSIIDGKKLSAYSGDIYTVAVAPGITGGTVTADRSTAVTRSSPAWDNSEKVTLTLTPDAGNFLSAASWNDGTTDYNISASDLATAQSTGKWIFNSPSGNGGKTLTFTATFTPIVASITSGGTTTYFATIADAFDAVADGETIVIERDDIDESAETYDFSAVTKHFSIDLNGKTSKLGIFSTKYGSLKIIDSSDGHIGKVEFASLENLGNLTIDGANVSTALLTNTNTSADMLKLDNGATFTTDLAQWYSKTVLLDHGSHWTAKNSLFLDCVDDFVFGFGLTDNSSWLQLVDCTLSGWNTDHLEGLLTPHAPIGKTITVDGSTKHNVVLRRTWSLELKNAFNEISAGVPSATVTYFDAVPTFNPADPTTFDPADYVPAGETGANEITAINNSDGQDHYIIMHIVPHKGDIADPDDPDYWTNERLLYVMEGASAASRSRGPGISLNLPYLLKADEYDANLDPTDPDMQPRHDGAGWYYYKLPASHCAANGYTKSTLQGLAAPVFDMETVSLAQDLETGLVTLSRTTDAWTAELTYDRLHWPFTGTIDDSDKPKLKKLVMKYGGSALITLDATPASESASDEAKAAAAQAEINAQISHNYPYPVSQLEWNQQQIGGASAFGWFQGTNYSTDSYFWIDVPFTPLDPTEATYPAGTANNPWLIQNGEDLSMLAKCVNIGSWTAHDRYLRQTADIDLAAEGVTDFEPIASTGVVGLGFEGHYDGFGKTISHIDYECTRLPDLDGTKCFVGLFGHLFGMDDRPGWVKNVTLKDCEFKAAAGSCAVAVGTIAGYLAGHSASAMTISNCKVLGSTVVSGLPANCGTGAIVGHCDYTEESNNSLANNYYGYGVTVTNAGGTAEGYTPRGYSHGLVYDADADAWTYEWLDVADANGAKLWVKKATPPAATTSGSTVAFSQTTTPADADATHPADCYSISGTDYYYAVDQPVTLSITTGSASPDGVRTFYDELSTLTMNDGTADTDIKDALGFTMPGTDVTIAATFTPSKWFTINTVNYNADDPSLPFAYNWMTFYHEWTDGIGTAAKPANYKVTNYDNPLLDVEVMTVSRVNSADGTFALVEVDGGVDGGTGICFSGVPTIFHYAVENDATAVLPQKLKFTPVDPNDPQAPTGGYAEPTVAKQFQGTVSDKTLTADDKCYVLNNAGDFILAYPTEGDDKIAAHKSYIDLSIEDNGNTQAPARLVFVGDETGIGRLAIDGSSDGASDGPWYSLDGRRLNGQPTRKGIYIYKGKKTVVK